MQKAIIILFILSVLMLGCQLTGKAGTAICKDSDGGAIYNVLGRTADHTLIIADQCGPKLTTGGQLLYEGICTPDGAELTTYVCPHGCFNGMCNP